MDAATATPKKPALKREVHTEGMAVQQKPDIKFPGLDEAFERDPDIVQADADLLKKEFLAKLAFNEEPLIIRIEPTAEKNPPRCIDLWVNGKGAEVFDMGLKKWISYGALPVGKVIVTRRKYVEVLARSKYDAISTEVIGPDSERPENVVHRATSQRATFSVIRDDNPLGAEWLARLVYYQS